MNTVDRLLAATTDIWKAYNEHPFVLGIQNGTLDKDKFRYYMIQDYLYLEDYAKTFAVGVAKAKSLRIANLFAKYIPVMNGELDVHNGYLARLGVTQEEINATPRSLDNLSYTSYMLRVAYEEGEAEILAAILSCAYSYEIIAKNIVKNNDYSFFSLLNITGCAKGITITDAKYPLTDGEITCEYQYGVSNEVLPGEKASVSVRSGKVLLIKIYK